ncbi:hypothetical protein [Orrella daihaiensis]|uniref:Uncharacterized protein n=1 Tax=Orrella daihaiensis TaxID=2782176 RepID=A0ABY4AJ83_9BURK|nr:hypothetical protein [Orrella daihaiensis]UOD50361.1 hypothetical protein DHf2319_13190 [Orrella daihaiensis]
MRYLVVVLLAVNVLMFGLGQGWFGSTNIEPGRQPGMMQTQLNAQALTVGVARVPKR